MPGRLRSVVMVEEQNTIWVGCGQGVIARRRLAPLILGVLFASISIGACAEDPEPLCVTACRAVAPRLETWRPQEGSSWHPKVDCSDPVWVERSTSCYTCNRYVDAMLPINIRPGDVPQCSAMDLVTPDNCDAGARCLK